ncbi:unnamed protein product, partial [Linum tenue]
PGPIPFVLRVTLRVRSTRRLTSRGIQPRPRHVLEVSPR